MKKAPIHIYAGCWIAARAMVRPGISIGKGAVLGLGSVTGRSLDPMMIYAGNPAQPIKERQIRSIPDDSVSLDTLDLLRK